MSLLDKSPKWLNISLAAMLAVGLVGGPTAAMATGGDDESQSVESTEPSEPTDSPKSEDENLNEENTNESDDVDNTNDGIKEEGTNEESTEQSDDNSEMKSLDFGIMGAGDAITPTLIFTPGTCQAKGSVVADETEFYSWVITGPESARVYTAAPKDGETLTQTVFGPYDLRQLGHMNPACQPEFEVVALDGYIKITYVNNSRWDRWPDYTYTGDGVTPNTSYGFPYYTPVMTGPGETKVIFEMTFPEDYNGGSVQVTYQDKLGAESDISSGPFTVTVNTDLLPPVAIGECTALTPQHFTSLSGWDLSQTRATGHNQLVDGGLHVWTEGNTSTDKAAGYFAVNLALEDLGTGFGMDVTTASGSILPALQIVLETGAILVYEPSAYGTNNVWSNQTVPGLSGGMGYTSFGSVNAILAADADIRVLAIGYSLGSGVLGDHTITKITVGCVEYTFGTPQPVVITNVPVPVITPASYTCDVSDKQWKLVPGNITFPAATTGTKWQAPAGDNVSLPWISGGGTYSVPLGIDGNFVFDVNATNAGWLFTETLALYSWSWGPDPVLPADPCGAPVIIQSVTLINHTCDVVGTVTIPPHSQSEVVYRLGFASENGVFVALPAGTYPLTIGLGITSNSGHPQYGEPIYDLLTVNAHEVATWPNDPLESWSLEYTEPADCDVTPTPPPTGEQGDKLAHTGADDVILPIGIGGLLLLLGVGVVLLNRFRGSRNNEA